MIANPFATDRCEIAFRAYVALEDHVIEHNNAVEWIIANTINETAQSDPDALATRIVAALEKAGYEITPDKCGSQPFDESEPDDGDIGESAT